MGEETATRDAGRFERGAGSEAAELFDRLERQAVEIARLRGQLRASQKKLAAERAERRQVEARLAGSGSADGAPSETEQRLAELTERNRVLEHQVEVAWAQLGVLETELGKGRKRRWRRRRRPPLPPAT